MIEEENSLFIDYRKKTLFPPEEDIHGILKGESRTLEVQEILEFLKLSTPSSKNEQLSMAKLVSDMLEGLERGDMAYSVKEKDMGELLFLLEKWGWGDIFYENHTESFSKTTKFLVFVKNTIDGGGFFYFQKQWNTYISLKKNLQERIQKTKMEAYHYSTPLTFLNTDQQKAVEGVWNSPFSLVLGGPGTGKTMVAASIVEGILERNPEAQVVLLAPTGRAGARLKESLKSQWKTRAKKTLEEGLEDELTPRTIERFLYESQRDIGTQFPMEKTLFPQINFLLIDEISMVSPFLFRQLLSMIPLETQIVLLGDPHQLPSVSEGFLLGYFLHSSIFPIFSLSSMMRAENQDLNHILTQLQKQFVSPNSIAPSFFNLSEVQSLNFDSFFQESDPFQGQNGVFFLEIPREDQKTIQKILQFYIKKYFLTDEMKLQFLKNPQVLFHYFFQNQLLTPTKQGLFGVTYINKLCGDELISLGEQEFKPIIISRNQPSIRLFNGDLGILRNAENKEVIYFSEGEKLRSYHKESLMHYEDCFAMTVHKTQGSEFNEIFLLLPSYALSRILSREIFYTAISRAKKRVLIISYREILERIFYYKKNRENGLSLFLQK